MHRWGVPSVEVSRNFRMRSYVGLIKRTVLSISTVRLIGIVGSFIGDETPRCCAGKIGRTRCRDAPGASRCIAAKPDRPAATAGAGRSLRPPPGARIRSAAPGNGDFQPENGPENRPKYRIAPRGAHRVAAWGGCKHARLQTVRVSYEKRRFSARKRPTSRL